MEDLKLTTRRKEVPVVLTDGEGDGRKCTLRELDGSGRDTYLTELSEKLSIAADGKIEKGSNFEGLQGGLISRCLFDENNKPVSLATIQGWPAGTLTKLFEAAQELNGLGEAGKAAAKNS